MKKKGGLRYSDAMYLFKTTPIITYWLPQAGLPILPNIEECVLTFTNTTYSSLHIKLPNPIIDIVGTQIKLPTMSGQYEDEYNFYTPLRWSVGDFGQVIKLKRHNFTANLEFTVVPKIVTYTIDFTNTTYPQFHVALPEALIVPEGDSAILPSVTGTFEDEEYLYTPQEWSIGNFGDTYTPSANVTTNLIWNVQPKTVTYTLSFTNTEYPEFDLPLPEPIIAEEGSSVTLPSVTGVYEDDLNTYTPDRWDLGDFGDSVTLDENKVADLIWLVEPIQGKLPLGGIITTTTDTPLIVEWVDGLVEAGGYAYPDGSIIGMPYSIGGVIYPDIQLGMFILVDASTGRVTSTLFEPHGLVFEETGHYTVESGSTLIFIRESSVETESFYFTSNGVNELNNTTLVSMNYLYTSTGEVVMQDNPLYDVYENAKPVSLMDVEGNIFEKETDDTFLFSTSNRKGILVTSTSHSSKGKQAWSVQFEKLAPSIPSIGGVLTSNSDSHWYIPYGGIIEEWTPPIVTPTLTLDLYYSSTKAERTFDAGQYRSGFVDPNEYQAVLDFGIPLFDNGQYGKQLGVFSEGYEYELLALLDSAHNVIQSDMSNFYLNHQSNENGAWSVIYAIAAYSTASVYWRLKITKPDVLTGYYKPNDNQYFYWDERRSIKIYYDDYDVRTCVKATEYLDPRWADQPGYGDGTREIDPSKVSLQSYAPSNRGIMPSLNGVSLWVYSVVVIEYILYKEMTLYTHSNENGALLRDFQPGITSNSTENDINKANVGLLKTSNYDGGNAISYDSSKRYEFGYYNSSNVWTLFDVQSLSDMPSSTVSTDSTVGRLLVNRNGYLALWLVTNNNGSSSISTANEEWKVRIYNK